jgi:acyl-CoA hydrolase
VSKNRDWQRLSVTPEEAIAGLRSGARVFIHGASATPSTLVDAMVARTDLSNLTLYHLHTSGPSPFAAKDQSGRVRSVSLFTGPALREPIEEGRADFMPIFLSDIPALFRSGSIRLDAALVQLSPPDSHGCCTLGTSVDAAKAAVETAPVVIAEINEQMPRTLGNTVVPLEKITAFCHTNRPLFEHAHEPETAVEARIGEIVAELVEDGSTLQMGIGGIPDAVLTRLHKKEISASTPRCFPTAWSICSNPARSPTAARACTLVASSPASSPAAAACSTSFATIRSSNFTRATEPMTPR